MFNSTEMIANIRHEIQEASASVWSDAELLHGVQKTVALMSRLIPRRMILEATIGGNVTDESVTTPATASATYVVNAVTLSGETDGSTLSISNTRVDPPRRLTVTLTDANYTVTQLVITVKGYDQEGNYIEESWHLPELRVSGTAYQGVKYFNRIASVILTKVGGSIAAGDTVSVGTGNAYDSYVYLAKKAIKYHSDVVTSSPAGTTYTRNTDYVMDYINGGIKFVNGGSMAAGTAYLIDYKLDPYMLDISSLLPKESYIKIDRIEYPVGEYPPTNTTFETFGDIVLIKGKDTTLTEDKHLRLIYLKPWSAPNSVSGGDYPEHLDHAIIIGSVGQALIFKAEKYVQNAITNVAASKTLLDAISAVTAPTAPTITGYLTTAETALDAAITRFAAAVTEVDKMDAPLAASATAMGKVAAEIALGNGYLDTGSALITPINDADNVAQNYAAYAQAEAGLGQGYGLESQQDVALAMAWEVRAAREMAVGNSYVNEAVQRLAEASRLVDKYQMDVGKYTQDNAYYQAQLAKSREYQTTGAQYLETAGRYLSSGQAKINEFLIMLGVKPEFFGYKGSSEQFS